MKAIASKNLSTIRSTPVIHAKHPSYRSPVYQAAAALRHLSERYRLKKKSLFTSGHA